MSSKNLILDRQDHIAVLTLNRPHRHNAFNFPMMRELAGAWEEIRVDDDIRCVVVTGAGDRAFCTGMDLGDVGAGDAEALQATEMSMEESPILHLTALQNRCWKPVITAVNGMVCGGGFHFLADSDLIIASDTATFFDNHVAMGLVGGLEPVGLAHRIPLEAVFRLALLGGAERMRAEDALACHLVGEVVPPETLMARALELASAISRHSPTAVMRTKQVIWESLDQGLHAGLKNAWHLIAEHQSHPDSQEGARAFIDKRLPVWGPVPDLLKNQPDE